MDKSWVWHPRASFEYHTGATSFVKASSLRLGNPTEMLCPCIDCRNLCHQPVYTLEEHIVIRGMDHRYKRNSCWHLHGDVKTDKSSDTLSYDFGAYDLIRTALFGGEDNTQPHKEGEAEAVDSKEEHEFKKKLQDAETPLYVGCCNYTKISAIMGLYRIKAKSGMSENYFDQLLTLVHDMLPADNVLPRSTDEMKSFLKTFGFGYDMIHACKNDCILYRKQYEDMESCPRCNVSRWERDKHSGEEKKGIPAKVLRYFPIKDRFRRMFRSKRIAEELRWHINGGSTDGTMRHPVDSLTWANVNHKWPEFAAEPRNLRLGISTDGMNPFSIQNSKYSTWPVLLVNYNMHPTKCMKSENIMLTLLIPGPTAPSNNIDVYLAPLIDDLKDLWNEGIVVYDSFMKDQFTLRALLMWSISDYPGLGTLAGCKVKGKQACTVCGKGEKISNIPIGPNAAIVKVDLVYVIDAYMWRPLNDNKYMMGSVIDEYIAWPIAKIGLKNLRSAASPKAASPGSVSCNLNTSMLSAQSKCMLMDVNDSGEIVAEGKILSTNPEDKVHFVPLGPDASKILVEVVKVGNASLWKPNSEMEIVSDAMGSFVAWPNDKIELM